MLTNYYLEDIVLQDLVEGKKIDQGEDLVNPGDQQVIGNTEPRYAFRMTGRTNWNNFFVNFFLPGD